MFDRKDLIALRDRLDRQLLACGRLWMNLEDWKDLAWVPCEHCGGLRHPDRPHAPEPCDLCRVEQVMSS